jgi:regulator of nonsense transcripts 2
LSAPLRATLSALSPEQREKEDTTRISRQRPTLRVCSELALVGIIKDAPNRSGGEWIMKVLKELVCFSQMIGSATNQALLQLSNDPTLSSLPLLSTFLKSYSLPYLGIAPPSSKQTQISPSSDGVLSNGTLNAGQFPPLAKGEIELVEQDIRDRFRRMCEGYFDNVSKKLVIEHKVRYPDSC